MSITIEAAPPAAPSRPPDPNGTPRARWLTRRRVLALLLGGFALSRALYAWAGIRFDTSWLETSWQLVDPELLRHQLFSSVWFEHTQPPLFNLFVGIVLRWSPLPVGVSFELAYLALGFVLTLALYDLLVHLGARRVTAIVTTLLVVSSPAAVLYENALLYEYPTAVALTVALACAARFVDQGRVRWLACFTALAAVAVLTRSLLHPLWFVLVVVLAVLSRRPKGSGLKVVAAIGLPTLVIVAMIAKNQLLFGQPDLSSWFGMNLAHVTVDQLPADRHDALVDVGTLSPTAHEPAFQAYAAYAPWAEPCTVDHPNADVLAQPTKADGSPNFNDECYLALDDAFEADAAAATRADLADVARSEATAAEVTFMPSDLYPFSATDQAALKPFDAWYRRIALLDVRVPAVAKVRSTDALRGKDGTLPLSLTVAAAALAAVGVSVRSARRWRPRRASPIDSARLLTGATVVFVLIVGTVFEIGENYRIRYVVEPLMFACLGLVIDRLLVRWSLWRAAERPARPPTGDPATTRGG